MAQWVRELLAQGDGAQVTGRKAAIGVTELMASLNKY